MKKYSSTFSQMLQLIPRYEFQKAVNTYGAERHSKGFSSWEELVAMLFSAIFVAVYNQLAGPTLTQFSDTFE